MGMSSSLPTVIVADPDPSTQQQLVRLLETNFHCVVTGSLRETAQAIQREYPALLVLELDQPDGDGVAFIQYLQADPFLRRILIACVTQRRAVMDKIRAFRAGADDYMVKPLTPAANFTGRMLLLRRAGHIARAAR